MRRTFIILGLGMTLAGNAANAADGSPREERIGVGTGAVAGAVIGGPVGAIVGAAIGAKLGNNYHRKNERIESLVASLDSSSSRVQRLEQTIADLNGDMGGLESELHRLQANARPELVQLLQAGIEMDLLFRTDEHVLVDPTRQRVGELAATLAAMPDIRVRLDGYADERGDADYNHELSARRAAFVRDLLVGHGVEPGRIAVAVHGESPAPDDSADSFALERKVSLTLFVGDTPSFAASP
ncbi:MAG: OmpA family protein [Woeseiaceae bacterium]|nr:OmpA family protein [Woeseiaceae bacterium]